MSDLRCRPRYGGVAIVFAAGLAFGLTPTFAKSVRELIAEGNQAYHGESYDDALDAYDKASVDAPESPQIYFNKGAVHYRKGDYPKARELFEQASLKTKDLSLEARAQYNLGNCAFREGERQRDSDLKKSMDQLKSAVLHYQRALELDPELKDAAHNIEIARLIMKQILDEIKKKEEEEKKKQEQQQQLAKKLEELIQRQEKLTKDTKALQDKVKKIDPAELQKGAEGLADEQGTVREETGKLAEQMTPPPTQSNQPNQPNQPDSPLPQIKEHLERATGAQDGAEKDLRKKQLASAQGFEKRALEEMKKALEAMRGDDQQQNQEGEQQQQQEPQQQAAAPRDETAHDILDEEKENRKRRQPPRAGGYRPVDKDW